MGSKKKPFYRINVADSRAPRDGRFIETDWYLQPLVEENQVTLKEERVLGGCLKVHNLQIQFVTSIKEGISEIHESQVSQNNF